MWLIFTAEIGSLVKKKREDVEVWIFSMWNYGLSIWGHEFMNTHTHTHT